MTPAFLRAVADTLLPGEAAAPRGETPLPAASAAGVSIDAVQHREVLQAIAARAGGSEFAAACEADRVAVLRVVEREHPATFRALVISALADYWESASTLAALGWRAEPPQPRGHALPAFDQSRLAKVRERGHLWRKDRRHSP